LLASAIAPHTVKILKNSFWKRRS